MFETTRESSSRSAMYFFGFLFLRVGFETTDFVSSRRLPSSFLSSSFSHHGGSKEDGTEGFESDEYTFQKLELPSQAGTFGATEPGPLGAVANGFNRFESRRPSSFHAVTRPSPSSESRVA